MTTGRQYFFAKWGYEYLFSSKIEHIFVQNKQMFAKTMFVPFYWTYNAL